MHAALALMVVMVGAAGCVDAFGDKDAHQPGEPLGSFHVVAKLESSTCGDGALGSRPSWEFDVRLSRDADELLWNNGREYISGAVASDGAFRIDSRTVTDMRTGDEVPRLPACTVERADAVTGTLSDPVDPAGFKGALSYAYAPSAGSDCVDLVSGEGRIFAALPCSMRYRLTATRTSEE